MPYTLLALLDCRPDNWNANVDETFVRRPSDATSSSVETECMCRIHHHAHNQHFEIHVHWDSVAVQIPVGKDGERVAANIHMLVGVAGRSVHIAIPKAWPPLQRTHHAFLQL